MILPLDPLSSNDISKAIEQHDSVALIAMMNDLYPPDIAEIINYLDTDEAQYLLNLLPKEEAASVLIELEDEVRDKLLDTLSSEEIAKEIIDHLDSDDAVDIIGEMSGELRNDVISYITDKQQAQDIVDLLNYDVDTAGGLMAKELVKVNETWLVVTCIREMRSQAFEVEHVYSVYVVDDDSVLKGILSLKSLLIASPRDAISTLYSPDVISIKAYSTAEEVAQIMKKYDLVVLPVVDEMNRLIGRITIDDVVDYIKDEADKDYQLMSGISHDIEPTDRVWVMTRGRMLWLIIALFGGIIGSRILSVHENTISIYPEMAFFMPLIAAMGGNVGVQSSALVVQALANNSMNGSILGRLFKELQVGLINGLVCSLLLLIYSLLFTPTMALSITLAISLLTVILFASVFGSFVPMILNRFKIDPALATGPFITTANDIIGLFIYFMIGRMMYGFFA